MRDPKSIAYTFNPTQGTIDFSANTGFNIRNLLGVAHPARGLIYSPVKAELGYVSFAGGILQLKVNTAGLSVQPLVVIYEDGVNHLPPDAATGSRQDAGNTTLEAIRQLVATAARQDAGNTLLTQIKDLLAGSIDFEETVWRDPATNAWYFRRVKEVEGTGAFSVAWTAVDGTVLGAAPAGVEPAARTPDTQIETAIYDATAGGAGYAAGDIIARVLVFNTRTALVEASFWHNLTNGGAISAPTSGTVTEQSKNVIAKIPQLPAAFGAKPSAQSLACTLAGDEPLALAVGTPADAPAADDVAAASLIALTRRSLARWTNLLGRFPASLGAKPAASSLAVTVASDDVLAQGLGAPADVAWDGVAASATLIGIAKAIRTKLGAVVLATGSAVIGRVGLQVGAADVAAGNPVPMIERATRGAIALTVGAAAVTPGRFFAVIASAEGNVSVLFGDGSALTVPVQIGFQAFPFEIVQVTAATATATYANLI